MNLSEFSFDCLFQPRRRLRPQKQHSQPAINPQTCQLVIQILHCKNLPVRKIDAKFCFFFVVFMCMQHNMHKSFFLLF